MLLFSGCSAPLKFHYNQKVKVVEGFYLDCTGTIKGLIYYDNFGSIYHTVLECSKDKLVANIHQRDLEALK